MHGEGGMAGLPLQNKSVFYSKRHMKIKIIIKKFSQVCITSPEKKKKNQQPKHTKTSATWNPQPKSIVFSNLQHHSIVNSWKVRWNNWIKLWLKKTWNPCINSSWPECKKKVNLAALEDQKLNSSGLSPTCSGSKRISSSFGVSSECTDCQDGNALTRQRKEIF